MSETSWAALERIALDPAVDRVEVAHGHTGFLCRAWTPTAIFASAVSPTLEGAVVAVERGYLEKKERVAARAELESARERVEAEETAGNGG